MRQSGKRKSESGETEAGRQSGRVERALTRRRNGRQVLTAFLGSELVRDCRCGVDGIPSAGLNVAMALDRPQSAAVSADASVLQATARRLGEACAADQVILFGSRASGHAAPDSDVDLALILPDGSDARESLSTAQHLLWPRAFPVDLVAITASVWRRKATLLARQVATHGVVLYDRRAV